MKCRNHSLAFFTMCILATAAFTSGCTTTGMDRSAKTSNSIEEIDMEVRELIVQIDATAISLDAVINPGQPDLKDSFKTYSKNVAKLDKEGTKVLKRVDEMKSNNKEYFAEWDKQGESYTNPRIRELSEERRAELAKIYARVPESAAGIRGYYQTYMTNLKEIQLYLSNDLTPKGVESITPTAQRNVQNLESLKASFPPVLSALDEIKAELYNSKK